MSNAYFNVTAVNLACEFSAQGLKSFYLIHFSLFDDFIYYYQSQYVM